MSKCGRFSIGRLVAAAALIALLVPLITLTAQAATKITAAYPNFSGSTAFQLNSNAVISGNSIRLTEATVGLWGSAFRRNRVTLSSNYSFSTQFTFHMNNGSGSPADGLAFCIQTAGNNAGSPGGGMGYGGVSPSLCVEFDTYYNPDQSDSTPDHYGVMINGYTKHGTGGSSAGWTNATTTTCGGPTRDYANFNNGAVYTASIDYDGTTLSLYMDCDYSRLGNTLIGSTAVNLGAIVGTRDVYVGFTAATGGEFQNHWIDSFYFNNVYNPAAAPGSGTGAVDVNAANTSYGGYAQGPTSLVLTPNPTTQYANLSSTLTANVKNENGSNASGETVSFTTTAGTLSASSAVSDGSGNAVVNLTGPGAPATANLRADAATGAYDTNSVSFICYSTNTSVTTSKTPVVYIENPALTFRAIITNASAATPIPTGNVTFKYGGVAVSTACTNVALDGTGQATCNASLLPAGNHVITVDYNGGGGLFCNSTGTLSGGQVINKASLTFTVDDNPPATNYRSRSGEAYPVNWTVAVNAPSIAPLPGDTFRINDGTGVFCVPDPIGIAASGICSLTSTTVIPAGENKTLTSTYAGSANYNDCASGSTCGTHGHMVYGLTTLSLTKTPNKAVILPGENVWYTIRVTNTGGFYALDTTIADTLPPNVIFRFMTGTDWTCINTGNISVACSYSKMIPNGASAPDMTLYITSPQATEKDNVITNTINGALWNPAAPVTPATGVITAKGVPIPMLDMAGYILLTVLLAGTSLIILMRRH